MAAVPEVRVSVQQSLFDSSNKSAAQDEAAEQALPDILSVMDLQQEQLARSLGDGHRVIHGVAGSGKTHHPGLSGRAFFAQTASATKPILVLCYNEPLAVKLEAVMASEGPYAIGCMVRNFHQAGVASSWSPLARSYVPNKMAVGAMFDAMIDRT